MFLDELNVALNVCERSSLGLMSQLGYDQHFPPLQIVIIDWISQIFGCGPMSLRFLPFLFGIVSLILFYLVLIDHFRQVWSVILLLAMSSFVARYQTELKQYSGDILVSIGFLWIWFKAARLSWKRIAIAGVLMLFMSMPAIFLAAGSVVYWWLSGAQSRSSIFKISVTWAAAFAGVFWLNILPSLGSEQLQDFHATHFFSFVDWRKSVSLCLSFFAACFGGKTIVYVALFIPMLVALTVKSKDYKALFGGLLVVVSSLILASALQYYSFVPRLLLFTLPLFLVVWLIGFEYLFDRVSVYIKNPILRIILFFALFILPCLLYKNVLFTMTSDKGSISQSDKTLYAMVDWLNPKDEVWLSQFAVPSFNYYTACIPESLTISNKVRYFTNPASIKAMQIEAKKMDPNQKIWIFISHQFNEQERRIAFPKAERIISDTGSYAVYGTLSALLDANK